MWKVTPRSSSACPLRHRGDPNRHYELKMVKPALWAPAWLAGMLVISALGRYGDSQLNLLPSWVDLLVVIVFSSPSTTGRSTCALPGRRPAQLAQDAHELNSI